MGWISFWFLRGTAPQLPPLLPPAEGDSPFPPNAVLVFQFPQPLLVVAYLRPSSNAAYQQEALVAGGVGSVALKGRAVSPSRMPNTLQAEQQADCTLWRVDDLFALPAFASIAEYEDFRAANPQRITQQGQFHLEPITVGVFGVEDVLGDGLRGYLQTAVSWGDG